MTDMVTHKATPECPITQPHEAEGCGFIKARRERQAEGDAAIRRQQEEEKKRVK